MELYERLLHLRHDPARIAAGFAEYMRHYPAADRAQIPAALASTLQARGRCLAQLEELERERVTPWDDFGGAPSPGQLEASAAQRDNEAEAEAARINADISALDSLFRNICRALDAEGLTLTGGEISALKRAGLPEALAADLARIKREHLASIPAPERLEERTAAALYAELTRQGLISGPYAAFSYYLGELNQERGKAPAEGLKWTGNKAEFAYFARRFADYTQPGGVGQPYIREKALCRAFGFDDRQRVNVIRPYLSDQHQPRTSARIEAAFTAAARSAEDDPRETSTN